MRKASWLLCPLGSNASFARLLHDNALSPAVASVESPRQTVGTATVMGRSSSVGNSLDANQRLASLFDKNTSFTCPTVPELIASVEAVELLNCVCDPTVPVDEAVCRVDLSMRQAELMDHFSRIAALTLERLHNDDPQTPPMVARTIEFVATLQQNGFTPVLPSLTPTVAALAGRAMEICSRDSTKMLPLLLSVKQLILRHTSLHPLSAGPLLPPLCRLAAVLHPKSGGHGGSDAGDVVGEVLLVLRTATMPRHYSCDATRTFSAVVHFLNATGNYPLTVALWRWMRHSSLLLETPPLKEGEYDGAEEALIACCELRRLDECLRILQERNRGATGGLSTPPRAFPSSRGRERFLWLLVEHAGATDGGKGELEECAEESACAYAEQLVGYWYTPRPGCSVAREMLTGPRGGAVADAGAVAALVCAHFRHHNVERVCRMLCDVSETLLPSLSDGVTAEAPSLRERALLRRFFCSGALPFALRHISSYVAESLPLRALVFDFVLAEMGRAGGAEPPLITSENYLLLGVLVTVRCRAPGDVADATQDERFWDAICDYVRTCTQLGLAPPIRSQADFTLLARFVAEDLRCNSRVSGPVCTSVLARLASAVSDQGSSSSALTVPQEILTWLEVVKETPP